MRKITFIVCLLFSVVLYAQKFDKNWKKVIALEQEGKISSAYREVQHIYKKARNRGEEAEMVKTFFYTAKYLQVLEEDSAIKIIENLKQDIQKSSVPTQSLLQHIYARCLESYLNKNRTKISKLSNIDYTPEADFRTWPANRLQNEIETAYQKSTEAEAALQKTPQLRYEAVFDFEKYEDFKNYTLFDFLATEAIKYYRSRISYVSDSKITEETRALLCDTTGNFRKTSFRFLQNEALKQLISLYQKLEKNEALRSRHQFERLEHLQDILAIDFIPYLKILDRLPVQKSDTLTRQDVLYRKASIYQSLASKAEHLDYNRLAVKTYDSILALGFSNAYKKAANDRNEITRESFTIRLLKQVYNGQHTRASISYKNTNNVTISFYKITTPQITAFYRSTLPQQDSIKQYILHHQKPEKKVTYTLENKNDYFEYNTEVIVPVLKTGNYLCIFESRSKNDSISTANDILSVSDISLLNTTRNGVVAFEAYNRKTGKPLENVTISGADFDMQTNSQGYASSKMADPDIFYPRYILAIKDQDTLFLNFPRVYNQYEAKEKADGISDPEITLLLDRAIYRPGQTLYYKGIAIWKKNEITEVVSRLTAKVSLKDPKGNTIKEVEVHTNEFGSFSGDFQLPQNGLPGNYHVEATAPDTLANHSYHDTPLFWNNTNRWKPNNTYFQVAEYKRPNFRISFDPIVKSYTINQQIELKGNAKAFSGSPVTNAKVTYKISMSRYNYYNTILLTTGETQTDANGNFTIAFTAEPDPKYPAEQLPVFNYEVDVSITDINGETRENSSTVNAGYHQLSLEAGMPPVLETGKKEFITLNSTNLNGSFIPAKGILEFYYTGPIRNKWKKSGYQPEIKAIDDAVFDSLFPYEERMDKTLTKTLVFKKNVNTQTDRSLPLDFTADWKTGNYKVVFSAKDASGYRIERVLDFRLFQHKDKQKPSDKLFTVQQLNQSPLKDGYIKIAVTSNFADLYLNTEAYYNNASFYRDNFQLQNKTAVLQIPVKPHFEEEIKLRFQTVFDNRVTTSVITVALKNEQQEVGFEVERIRNKIEPGSLENWVFRVKSKDEAEVLASMYDSSLDRFNRQEWEKPERNDRYQQIPVKSTLGFDTMYQSISYLENPYFSGLNTKSNTLIWFGFNFASPNDLYTQKYYQALINSGKTILPSNTKTITGIVTEDGLPLPGVSITVKGTDRGTSTDMDGYYSIAAVKGEELLFNFVGMQTATVLVSNTVHNVAMKAEASQLSEVVVGALGMKKDEIILPPPSTSQEPEANMLQAIAGKASGLQINQRSITIRGTKTTNDNNEPLLIVVDGKIADISMLESIPASDLVSSTVLKAAQGKALYGVAGANGVLVITTKKAQAALAAVSTRKNFNETAFFYPHLKTDADGKISFSFTAPEALTQWKLRLFGHTKRAASGYYEDPIITQKELMLTPNFPRFLREKDTLFISAKIANMTFETKSGMAALQLFDAVTMKNIDLPMANSHSMQPFKIPARGNTEVSWKIVIPEGLQGVQYKVVAKAGNFSDGEENILPVLTNTLLVTESIPLWVRGNSSKTYTLDNLKNNTSTTLRNHQITLEYTSNPTWIALQSLPYLMEYEHECSEQTFARYYANVLATEIINSNPKIAALFDSWRKDGKSISKLEQNEELKSIILAETPWLRDAQPEEEQKKNWALLFDLEKMKASTAIIFEKLKEKQKASGGFAWFENGSESDYITRHIMAGFGHLSKMKINSGLKANFSQLTGKGISYMDTQFLKQHAERLKNTGSGQPVYSELHYLYTRSFYLSSYPPSDTLQKAITPYLATAKTNWRDYSLYEKALAALALNRFNEKAAALTIIESLKETAASNTDHGMYWIANKPGWCWYNAPIETQALLIEAFAEISNDLAAIEAMKVWLLKNKQNRSWPTTKATTEAVYALLYQGSDWLSETDNTLFKTGNEKIVSEKLAQNQKEAATGYIKLNWTPEEISPAMATITVENKSKVPGYGGYYWQYFEDSDKIQHHSGTVLSSSKELYVKTTTKDGDLLELLTPGKTIRVGDRITVRISIKATEDVEYVHLKDMRASGFEPVDVLSRYQWNPNISYYQSTRDAATHFFFDQIRKGVYVIEYEVRANNSGAFSNGITTIQSMYAPEFTSHSKGIRIRIKP